jgi:uncharacterized protein
MHIGDFFRRINYVTLKVTNGCNLKCSYCNVEAVTPQTPKMSLELFRHVADLLLANSESRHVGLEFHGGEPLLLSDEWFEEATGYARALAAKHHKSLELPLVTNGTMLTEERLKRLTGLGIRFCMSCDGPPEINDAHRGAGAAVERAIRLFQELHIYTGLICVLGPTNYARMTEVMEWFRGLGVRDIRVNYLQPQGRGIDERLLTGEEMFEGIRQVLDHMYQTDVAVQEVETLNHVARFVYGRPNPPRLTCWEFQCQAGRTYVAVDLLGRMHACGTDLVNHVLGNVYDEFDLDHYGKTLNRLHDKGKWVIRCFDCAAKQICNHSCSTSDYNSEMYKEYECRFTKLLWAHLCEHPEKAHAIDRVLTRRGPRRGAAFVPVADLENSLIAN